MVRHESSCSTKRRQRTPPAGRPLVVSSPTPHDVAGKQVVAQFEDEGYDPSEIVIAKAVRRRPAVIAQRGD